MTSANDMMLMNHIHTIATSVASLSKQRTQAYEKWIRLDHVRLTRAVEGKPESAYFRDRVAAAAKEYEEALAHYDERLESGLAWMQAEFAKREAGAI